MAVTDTQEVLSQSSPAVSTTDINCWFPVKTFLQRREEQTRSNKLIKRAANIVTFASIIVCIFTVALTISIKTWADRRSQNVSHEQHLDKICIECAKVNEIDNRPDPLIGMLVKRNVNGIQKCCAQTMDQVFELVRTRRVLREKQFALLDTSRSHATPINVHKVIYPSLNEAGVTEPIVASPMYNVPLLINSNMDTLMDQDHVRGVGVSNDSLVIQFPGLYYVYASVHFKPVSSHSGKKFNHKDWYMTVWRSEQDNRRKSNLLLQAAHTVCDNCTDNEQTRFTGGNFYLEKGDHIYLRFSYFGVVQFSKESTFVGLMMIKSGS